MPSTRRLGADLDAGGLHDRGLVSYLKSMRTDATMMFVPWRAERSIRP